MRKHYMTLCVRDNTEVTYVQKATGLEVTFEQSCNGGFKTLIFDEQFRVISNSGFNSSELNYFLEFLKNNISTIKAESRGDF